MSKGTQPTKNIINYWEAALTQYRFVMDLSTQVMIEQTIIKLKLLPPEKE